MKRLDFLRRTFNAGLLLTLPEGLFAAAKNNATAFTHISIFHDFVAGFQYYNGAEKLALMETGQTLDLVREPDNPHDSQAIAIYWEGEKIGFMPRQNNLIPSVLLDNSVPCVARIRSFSQNSEPWLAVEFEILLLYPTQFLTKKEVNI